MKCTRSTRARCATPWAGSSSAREHARPPPPDRDTAAGMRISTPALRGGAPSTTHLTYCTNVHAGESLADVQRNLREHVAAVKQRVSPNEPFGVGLWLSARAVEELRADGALLGLRALLTELRLYVFTLNGFPFGAFHGGPVKTRVYEPDWRDPRRLAYSNSLAELLAALLPEGVDGSISTLPCAFKPSVRGAQDEAAIAEQLLQHAAYLHALRKQTGCTIALALEPEPCCLLETTDETVAFFA